MPFGLNYAFATFQRTTDVKLSAVMRLSALPSLDDSVFFSISAEQHFSHLQRASTLVTYAGVTIQLKNCSFFAETICYLAHVIRAGKVEVPESTTDAIRQLQDLITQKETKMFLGRRNVLQHLPPNVSSLAALPNKMFGKGQP